MIALPPDGSVSLTYSNHDEYRITIDWSSTGCSTTSTTGGVTASGTLCIYDSDGTDAALTRSSTETIEFHQEEPGYSTIHVEVIELPKPPQQPPPKQFVMRPTAAGKCISPRRWRPRPRRDNIGVRNWKAAQ